MLAAGLFFSFIILFKKLYVLGKPKSTIKEKVRNFAAGSIFIRVLKIDVYMYIYIYICILIHTTYGPCSILLHLRTYFSERKFMNHIVRPLYKVKLTLYKRRTHEFTYYRVPLL